MDGSEPAGRSMRGRCGWGGEDEAERLRCARSEGISGIDREGMGRKAAPGRMGEGCRGDKERCMRKDCLRAAVSVFSESSSGAELPRRNRCSGCCCFACACCCPCCCRC